MARLDQICTLNMGQSPDSSSYNENNEGMPFFQGNADFGKIHPKVRVWCSSPTKIAHEGDVLISVRAPIGALNIADRECCIGRGLAALTVNEELCNKDYLWFAIASKVDELNSKGTGSTFKAISKNVLAETDIPLPCLAEQLKIARKLAKVDDMIALRKEQLAKLDQLVKSRFVELFIGKGYPTKTVDEVSLGKGEYGAQSASVEHDPTRPRYVRITDINDDGTLNDDVVASINPADDEQYKLEYGDFMFARMGATVGKTYAFVEGNQIFAGYLIRYRLNQTLINPRYLFWYTRLDEYWNWVKLNQSGAAQPGINAKKYGSLQIPLPSIEEQNAFAAFVEQTDKTKLTIKTSLDKLEVMKKSLMQQYFG